MKKKRILFVDDDPNLLLGLRRMLRAMRQEWEMAFVESGQAALSMMGEQPFDVVVSDMHMPGMDGIELLDKVLQGYPKTVRIVLSGTAKREQLIRSIGLSHQYLQKPCDTETLKQTVARACALKDVLTNDRLTFVSQMKNLPSLPEIYLELVEELQSDDPSLSFVARLVEKDVGMTAKILQLVNSAYFGISRHVSSPTTAVKLLGLENVRSLVMAASVFSQVDRAISVKGFSVDELWKHSMVTGRLSQEILNTEQKDKFDVECALTAGLLHDCGKLAFAANMGSQYQEALALAKAENLPVDEAEKVSLGASHAEVGAYLLGLWGLPDAIIEAVAFHHHPQKCPHQGVTPLTAVHVADAFEQRPNMTKPDGDESILDIEYLRQIGVEDRIETWCDIRPKE